MKRLGLVQTQNGDQDRDSTASDATEYDDPWDQSQTYAIANSLPKRRNSDPCQYSSTSSISSLLSKVEGTENPDSDEEIAKPVPAPRQSLSGKNNGGTRQGNQPSGENNQSLQTESIIISRRRRTLNDPPVPSTSITSKTTGVNNEEAAEACKGIKVSELVETHTSHIQNHAK